MRRLLHHGAQLAGEPQSAAPAAVRLDGRRFDKEHVATGPGDGESGRHARHGGAGCDLIVELGPAEELADAVGCDRDGWRELALGDLGRDLAGDLAELALEVAHPRL